MNFDGAASGKGAPTLSAPSWESDDIFHSDFKGTLFQIVSGRLTRTKERVEEYEWDLPMNRARQGVPQKPSYEGPRRATGATGQPEGSVQR